MFLDLYNWKYHNEFYTIKMKQIYSHLILLISLKYVDLSKQIQNASYIWYI